MVGSIVREGAAAAAVAAAVAGPAASQVWNPDQQFDMGSFTWAMLAHRQVQERVLYSNGATNIAAGQENSVGVTQTIRESATGSS